MTPLYRHTNYRSFLKAHAEDQRRERPGWSYGAWARKLRLKGTASLTMVVNGQRRPGPKMARALADYFKFGDRERRYFLDLIQLKKIHSDPRVKFLILEELRRLSPRGEFQLLDDKTFSAISHWHFYAIRQMCRMENKTSDAGVIDRRFLFPLGIRKVRAAIKTMLELGLLERDPEDGTLRSTDRPLTTSDDVQSEAIQRFHEEVLALSAESVRKFDVRERELRSATLCLRAEDLQAARSKIRAFTADFVAEFGHEGGNSVFQMAIQFFPLAREINEEKKS